MFTPEQIANNYEAMQAKFNSGAIFDHVGIAHLSETQKNALDVRAFKTEWAQIRKAADYTQITAAHYASLLDEIRSCYKSAKAKDLAENEFVSQAYLDAGKCLPAHAINVVAKSE